MIFIISSLIGAIAGSFRSAVVYAVAAMLLPCIFGASFVLSSVAPSLWDLGAAVLGYNFGLLVLISLTVVAKQYIRTKSA